MKISVITPSYNQCEFIERTLLSVLNQGLPDLEYLVFDGGSRDETLSILRRYESRLRWVSEPDRGQAHAVNKGLAAASGEIIGWLNSDDVYLPGALPSMLTFFAKHPEVDVIYGSAYHINSHDQIIEPYPTEDWNLARLADVCFLSQPAVFFRRRVVDRCGGLDESLRYCMDYEYWLRLGQSGVKVLRVDEFWAGSRLHRQTKTLGQRLPVHAEINTMLRQRLGRTPDRWLINYAHVEMETLAPGQTAAEATFVWRVAWRALAASWRWNRSVSHELLLSCLGWMRAAWLNPTLKRTR